MTTEHTNENDRMTRTMATLVFNCAEDAEKIGRRLADYVGRECGQLLSVTVNAVGIPWTVETLGERWTREGLPPGVKWVEPESAEATDNADRLTGADDLDADDRPF